jgi:predicted  nucleic acid-binding Zn-ribbon protein
MDFAKFELLESKLVAILESKAKAERRVAELEAALAAAEARAVDLEAHAGELQARAGELQACAGELEAAKERIATLEADHSGVIERLDALLGKLDV